MPQRAVATVLWTTLVLEAVQRCRHCHQLAYPSQREHFSDRKARRADRIREKLGWEPGILNGSGWGKPKGMHRKPLIVSVESTTH